MQVSFFIINPILNQTIFLSTRIYPKTTKMQGGETIFLIDDDLIQLKVAEKTIEQTVQGKTIRQFQEAGYALEYLKQHVRGGESLPDIILLDLNMPEMTGWDFLDIFENWKDTWNKEIKIYILTSSPDEADIRKSKAYPSVNGYIIKPLTREKILELFS